MLGRTGSIAVLAAAALTLLPCRPTKGKEEPGAAAPPGASRRITSWITGATLREAVPYVGRQAGSLIRCGENAKDRRFYLFVDDRPLAEVMGRLKKLVPCPPGKAYWFRSGSGSIFDEDIASAQARARAGAKAKRDYLKRARKLLERVRLWADGPEGPQAPGYAQRDARRYVALFDQLPRAQQDQALLGQHVRIPYSELPAGAKSAFIRAMMGDQPLELLSPKALQALETKARSSFLSLSRGRAPTQTPSVKVLLQTERYAGNSFPELLHVPRFGRDASADWGSLYDNERPRRRGPVEMKQIGALQKRVRWQPREGTSEGTAGHLLRRLASEGAMPLIGEFDPCASPARFGETPGGRNLLHSNWERRSRGKPDPPLWQVLEWACEDLDLYWDYDDGWLVIRSPRTVYSWAGLADLTPVNLPAS